MAAIWRQKLLLQKPDLDAKAKRRRFWSTFWKEFYNENQQLQNGKKSSLRLPNHHRTLDAASPIRFTTLQLQKTLVVSTQPQQRGTLTQPFHCDPPRQSWKAIEWRTTATPRTLSYTARANRAGPDGKATTLNPVAHASQLFSATESPQTGKT